MAGIMNTFGILMTGFLKSLAEIWNWLNSPLYIFGFQISIGGWQVIPIQIFGVGFGAIVIAIFIKSIVTW